MKHTFDQKLFDHLCEHIHFWNADAAGDAQLAGRVLQQREPSISEQGRSVFRQLKVVNWDAAHASRRLTSRPWQCDPFLYSLLQKLLLNKKALVRVVQNSEVFRSWLHQNLKRRQEERISAKANDFGYAAHRFNSMTKPLGRAVHNIFALVDTAMQITKSRSGHEAEACADWLDHISTEGIVQLAMLADAAHESLKVTRFFDRETCPSECASAELESYVTKITYLFVAGRVVEHGFTVWVLNLLRTKPMLIFHRGKPKMLGGRNGVSGAILEKCLARMRCWVRICLQVIDAEYPQYTLLSSFSVFNLVECAITKEVLMEQNSKYKDSMFSQLENCYLE